MAVSLDRRTCAPRAHAQDIMENRNMRMPARR
jgi:hypothetical protein